jgi:hypothetical protein
MLAMNLSDVTKLIQDHYRRSWCTFPRSFHGGRGIYHVDFSKQGSMVNRKQGTEPLVNQKVTAAIPFIPKKVPTLATPPFRSVEPP